MECPPTHPHVKLNFDGSVYNPIQAAAGFVVRNHLGNPVLAMSNNLGSLEILQAEGCALRDGLNSINPILHDSITVEGDSKILIDAINGKFTTPWRIKTIVADIQLLKLKFRNITFRHIWREANFVADKLANLGPPSYFKKHMAQHSPARSSSCPALRSSLEWLWERLHFVVVLFVFPSVFLFPHRKKKEITTYAIS